MAQPVGHPGGPPTGWRLWLVGARPRTLPAAVVPVAVGTACAVGVDGATVVWWRAVAALVVSLALQVATNYVNDYADGERGTDTERVGPLRLVGSGLRTAGQVKRAALAAFAAAGVAGAALALAVGPELLVVGAVSIVAGWAYTGGPKPYGYLGLGEVFVFVFFGLVATVGSAYVHTERVTGLSVVAAVPVGLLAVALLVVNNLRDIPGDAAAGKRTMAVRLGDAATRRLYLGLLVVAAAGIVACAFVRWPAVIALAGLATAVVPVRAVTGGATGPALIPVLGATGRTQLLTGLALAVGLALGG
ncbi:MAG: 1,4-dihydroxy-2-naphthoate polyprenyltransferase [Acidimicrobiales bacterium]